MSQQVNLPQAKVKMHQTLYELFPHLTWDQRAQLINAIITLATLAASGVVKE